MSDKQMISGGCACRAIRYSIVGESILALNCHCRDCQSASGSAFGSFVIVSKPNLELTGEPKYYAKTSDAGNAIKRGFCSNCGSPVTILEPDRPNIIFVHAGSFDDPGNHRPAMDIFIERAHPWDRLDPSTEKFPGMPPLPDDFGR